MISVKEKDPLAVVPDVYPDRLSFPFEHFPHVNYPHGNRPPSLCLSRVDAEEWYSGVSFRQFVETLIQWLDDAANDRLVKYTKGDEFEPYRVPNDTLWRLIRVSDFDLIAGTIHNNEAHYSDVHLKEGERVGYVQPDDANFDKEALYVNLFKDSTIIERTWFWKRPKNISDLVQIIREKGYVLDLQYLKQKLTAHPNVARVFVALSVIRPTKLVGKTNNVDNLCFTFEAEAINNNNVSSKVEPVRLFDTIWPFNAAWLSKMPHGVVTKRILVIGAGAVGSAIIDLLYRNGITHLSICDNDNFEPHNVCRHVLSDAYQSRSKAELMRSHLQDMYINYKMAKAINNDAVYFLSSQNMDDYDLIIDASASNRVMYALDGLNPKIPVIRTCLSDKGKVGMTYVRFPGDAFLHEYYFLILRRTIKEDDQLSKDIISWITSDRSSTLDRVRIGEGCHSITMQMGYDRVIAHASLATTVIKHLLSEGKSKEGNLYLSFADYDYPGSLYTDRIRVPDLVTVDCDSKEWTVRIPKDLLKEIVVETRRQGNKESGGYLMGTIDEKRQVALVLATHIPDDSKRSPIELTLGRKGWNEFQHKVDVNTCGQLQYLGDWHSHPRGTTMRSDTDLKTFNAIHTELRGTGVCLITTGSSHKAYIIG